MMIVKSWFPSHVILLVFWLMVSVSVSTGYCSLLQPPQDAHPLAASNDLPSQLREIRRQAALTDDVESIIEQIQGVQRQFGSDKLVHLQAVETITDIFFSTRQNGTGPKTDELAKLVSEYANQLTAQDDTNGKGALETSCRTAAVLEVAANYLRSGNRSVAIDLYTKVGVIARNLYQNPRYPQQARGGLAPLLIAEAKAYVLKKEDGANAISSINLALEWGLVEFEKVLDDELFQNHPNFPQIKSAIATRESQYRQQVTPAIKAAVANFKSFPFDFALKDIDQNVHAKSHYSNGVLVVDIWGTWCAPCRAEIPHLNRLESQHKARGVRVVGIAIEQGDTFEERTETLKAFLQDNEVKYECLLGDESITKQVPNFNTYPTLIFMDRTGKVCFSTTGYLDYTQMQVIVDEILNKRTESAN